MLEDYVSATHRSRRCAGTARKLLA
jgi:hypothetical protein